MVDTPVNGCDCGCHDGSLRLRLLTKFVPCCKCTSEKAERYDRWEKRANKIGL